MIVTHDDDFLRLAVEGVDHLGISYGTEGRSVRAMVQGLTLMARILPAETMRRPIEVG